MIGTLYIEHVGTGSVKNAKTGEIIVIEYKAEGYYERNKHEIEGYVYRSEKDSEAKDHKKRRVAKIYGTWTKSLHSVSMKDGKPVSGTEKLLWVANP